MWNACVTSDLDNFCGLEDQAIRSLGLNQLVIWAEIMVSFVMRGESIIFCFSSEFKIFW